MDPIDAVVERRIKEAAERGELELGALKGKPIPDLDTPRQPGWFAKRLVAEERARAAVEAAADATRSTRR